MRLRSKWILFMSFICVFSLMMLSFTWGDEAIVKGTIEKKGEGYIVVKITETGIFKKGSLQTFYIYPKTKIIMAGSKTPLVLDSLLIGDKMRITLGKIGKTKDGKMIQYVNKMVVFSGHQ